MTKLLLTITTTLACLASLYARQSGKITQVTLFQKEVILTGNGQRGPYVLPDSLILASSEQVWLDGELIDRSHYRMNYIDGDVTFNSPIARDSSIRIFYQMLPYPIRKRYYHRRMVIRAADSPIQPPAPTETDRPARDTEMFGANLTRSGSIVRGITIGSNRDLKLDSGLRMQVSGKVSDNIEVIASLTDQSTPIQPEGNTQTLQEIDKVFVQIKAPKINATLGDYNLEITDTEFSRYNRKLQGAMTLIQLDHYDAILSGAVSRGNYFTNQFNGQEGYQGPYQLKGDRGQIAIIVLAGTERVFIDGETMTRGESNDYTIDYSNAQITFTRRRLITADSRITVDFQYSDEKFRRNLYSARFRSRFWQERIKFGATLLHEADDKDNPLDFVLNEDYLNVLNKAGDNSTAAAINGASFVGTGKGRYRLNQDGYFEFLGADLGDYNVSFSDVGEGRGDYRYRGGGVYEFVGTNQGRYAPLILLPPASSHNIMGFDGEITPLSYLKITGEIAISRLDLNTYSTFDDNDNHGLAYHTVFFVNPPNLSLLGRNLGKFSSSFQLRKITDRFNDIDRTQIVEYGRMWDLPQQAKRGEQVQLLKGSYIPKTGIEFDAEYGKIDKGSLFNSQRWQATTRINLKKWPELNYRIENINKSNYQDLNVGTWLRQMGQAAWSIWKFKPGVNYSSEIKKENWSDTLFTGFKFDDVMAGLEFNPIQRISLSAKLGKRQDWNYNGNNAFTPTSKALTRQYRWAISNLNTFSAALEYTHRERSFNDPNQENKRTDLADLVAKYSPFRNAITTEWHYQVSNTAVAQKDRIYIKVSEGDGDYRFDEELNEYVNVGYGNYVMRIITSDRFIPVVELKTEARFQFIPKRLSSPGPKKLAGTKKTGRWLNAAIQSISTETNIRIEEKSKEKEVWQIYKLNLDRFQNDSTTIFGNISFRQDLNLFENMRNLSLRLRVLNQREKNNQFLEGGQDRLLHEYSARFIYRLSDKTSSEINLINKRMERTFNFAGRQDRNIHSHQINLDFSYRPKQPLEFALKSKFAREQDRSQVPATEVWVNSLEPRLSYAFLHKGRIATHLEWTRVTATPITRALPYELASGNRPGTSIRWGLELNYRVSKNVQARVSYTGRNEPDRDQVIHTGTAEMRAFF